MPFGTGSSSLYQGHQDEPRDFHVQETSVLSKSYLEAQHKKHAEPIDAEAVLNKCCNVQHQRKLQEREQNECALCLEEFRDNDDLLSLPCNHRFHGRCVMGWITSNHACCPSCRAAILEADDKLRTTALGS